MVAVPIFYRHGHETKLPIYLLWPTSRGEGLQEDWNGACSLPAAAVGAVWVGNSPHDMAFKEQEGKAAPKQQHWEKKAGARDPIFNKSNAKSAQFWSCPNQLTASWNLFPNCLENWNSIVFNGEWHGPYK